jgi:integrase
LFAPVHTQSIPVNTLEGIFCNRYLSPDHKRAPKTAARDKRMVRYLNAGFGDIAVADLEVKHLADILDKYEQAGKFETRVRVQGAAIAIMGFAAGRGHVKTNPFIGVNFGASFTAPENKKRPAITDAVGFGHLLRKIDHYEGRDDNLTGIALNLLTLTFVRPGDVTKSGVGTFRFRRLQMVGPLRDAEAAHPAQGVGLDPCRRAA